MLTLPQRGRIGAGVVVAAPVRRLWLPSPVVRRTAVPPHIPRYRRTCRGIAAHVGVSPHIPGYRRTYRGTAAHTGVPPHIPGYRRTQGWTCVWRYGGVCGGRFAGSAPPFEAAACARCVRRRWVSPPVSSASSAGTGTHRGIAAHRAGLVCRDTTVCAVRVVGGSGGRLPGVTRPAAFGSVSAAPAAPADASAASAASAGSAAPPSALLRAPAAAGSASAAPAPAASAAAPAAFGSASAARSPSLRPNSARPCPGRPGRSADRVPALPVRPPASAPP